VATSGNCASSPAHLRALEALQCPGTNATPNPDPSNQNPPRPGNQDNSSTSQTHQNVIDLTPSSPAYGWDECDALRHIHIPPPIQYCSLLMKTINKLPPARQSRTCVLTTKASTRLRHSLVPSTPSRFQPSTPLPTHTSDTPPHSHIFITHCKIRHYATAISSIQARFVVMYTF